MKRFLCMMFSILMTFIPLATVFTADSRAADEVSPALYDIEQYHKSQYNQYRWIMRTDSIIFNDYLANDSSFAYTQAVEKLGNDWYFQACLNSVEFMTNAGWSDLFKGGYNADDVKVQYYVTALSSLLMTMESNWSDVKQAQSNATSTMTWVDYAADAASAATGILAVNADGVWETAFDICGLTADALGGSIDTVSDFQALMAFSDQYLRYHDFLELIAQKSDDHLLTRAAQCLVKVTDLCYTYYINYFDTCVDIGFNTFFTVLDKVLEQEKKQQTLSSDEWAALNGISHLAKGIDSFKLGIDIGKLVCDTFIKSSDLMLRYYEIRAMASVRKVLLSEIRRLDRSIDGPEDWKEIEAAADMLADLNYVNLRGEYCVYRIQTEDGGLLSCINVCINGKKDDWFNDVVKTCQCIDEIISTLIPDWKDYRIGYGSYDDVIAELTDGYGVFATEQSGVMIGPDSRWLDPTGVMNASRLDLDSDGEEELLVCMSEICEDDNEQYNIVMQIYDKENGSIALMDTVILGAYIDPEDKIPVSLTRNAWQKKMIAIHAVKTNGRTYLFCEDSQSGLEYYDASYNSLWLMEYADGVLRYVCSFTQVPSGPYGYPVSIGYAFENGMCSSPKMLFDGTAWSDIYYVGYWQTAQDFFGKYEITLKHFNTMQEYWESSLVAEKETQMIFKFLNKIVKIEHTGDGYEWKDYSYTYRATLETEENTNEKNVNEDLHNAYLRFLETKGYEDYVTDWIHGSPAEYAILDIDADGREELLLKSDTETGFYDFSVLCCDLSQNEAYWLEIPIVWKDDAEDDGINGQYYSAMEYSPEYHALVCTEMNNPSSLFDSYSYFVVRDKALARDFYVSYERSNESEPYSYSIGNYDNTSGRIENRMINKTEYDAFMDGCIAIEWLPLP